jgi:integrase
MFPFTPELRALLEAQRAVTHKVQAETKQIIKHVFHRDGRPIKSFRGAWQAAGEAAGVPGRIFHDFRRTAVRALERAGVPRSVSMKLTGHQTESVYRRYAIRRRERPQSGGRQARRSVGGLDGHSFGHSPPNRRAVAWWRDP